MLQCTPYRSIDDVLAKSVHSDTTQSDINTHTNSLSASRSQIRPDACKDVPNIVAASFVDGIDWMRPSGPGHICTLIIHCLFWADSTKGDDEKASIDKEIRDKLSAKLGLLVENERFSSIDQYQRVEIERLKGILRAIGGMPVNHYLNSTHQYLVDQLDFCAGRNCDEEANMTCSKCKTMKYCGQKHQVWHWKNGHKLRCFPPLF